MHLHSVALWPSLVYCKAMTDGKSGQRDYMRKLVSELGRDRDAVCHAYAGAELDGLVVRSSDDHSLSPMAYARALWNDGERKGWLDS